jgi:hypothetical protein
LLRSSGFLIVHDHDPTSSTMEVKLRHHGDMTRPEPVRYIRTEATMAFPDGRLIAIRDTALYVLVADGWSTLTSEVPPHAVPLTREDAEDWCEHQGWDLELLDAVPRQVA